MIRIVLALAALVLFMPVAQAASFDCARAGTSFEKAICANPDLSRADETLAKAYATALGGLSQAAANTLKATQHDWLGYAERACSDDAQPIPGAYDDDQTACLAATFRDRIKALEASRMQGGYRFYPLEQYLVEKDPDATDEDSFVKVGTKHYETVKIDGWDDVAAAFNALIDQAQKNYDGGADEDAKLFDASGKLKTGNPSMDVDATTTVSAVTDYRITLTSNSYWYGHGAAHGNYGISYRHFVIAEKRWLEASDIFAGKDWQKTFGKLVVDRLKADLGDLFFPEAEADVPEMAADPTRWTFSEEGLIVQFQPYEVASYADGAVTATVPWNDVNDLLAEHALEIATY